ncbi:MAG: ABC transporter permease [Asgard group archaeon]|nr:ABC transporter permease [Asgard group archaeon]
MSKDKTQEPKEKTPSQFGLSLKRIGAYFTAAFLDFRRSPLNIFFTVAYPIILILLFGAIFSEGGTVTYVVYYYSAGDDGFETIPGDNSSIINFSSDLIETFTSITHNDSTPLFDMRKIPDVDEQSNPIDIVSYLTDENGYIAMLLPFNLTQLVIFNPPVNISILVDENSQDADFALGIVSNIITGFNFGIAGVNSTQIGMETVDIYSGQIEYFEFLIPGIVGITIMNNGVIGTINRYTFYEKKGLFRKLSSSPMTKGEVVTGEATWVLFQGIISIVAVLLIGWLVFKVPSGEFGWILDVLDWKIIPITIAAVLNFTGLGMISSRIVRNPEIGTAVGNFISFPMMFLSGAFFEIGHIPVIREISYGLPLTYVIKALRASMITPNISIAWINIGISFAIGIVLFTIGILITKLSER